MARCNCGAPVDGLASEYYHGSRDGYPMYTWEVCDDCGAKLDHTRTCYNSDGEYHLIRYENYASIERLLAEYTRLGWAVTAPWDAPFYQGKHITLFSKHGGGYYRSLYPRDVWERINPNEKSLYELLDNARDYAEYSIEPFQERSRSYRQGRY